MRNFYRHRTDLIRGNGASSGRWRVLLWLTIACLLVLPWIAMQFTREVAWTASDFAIIAVLLISAGLAFELLISKVRKPVLRLVIASMIITIVALIWADGAVGIFQ